MVTRFSLYFTRAFGAGFTVQLAGQCVDKVDNGLVGTKWYVFVSIIAQGARGGGTEEGVAR